MATQRLSITENDLITMLAWRRRADIARNGLAFTCGLLGSSGATLFTAPVAHPATIGIVLAALIAAVLSMALWLRARREAGLLLRNLQEP